MKENGGMDSNSAENLDANSSFTRFMNLVGRARRAKIVEAEAPPQPSVDEIRSQKLEVWLREAPCAQTFIPWLDELAAKARMNAHLSISNHAEMVKWLGVDLAYSTLIDEILKITG